MRTITTCSVIIFTLVFFGACGGQESSSDTDTDSLEENEVVVTVDGEEWSTTNVRLAGSHVFGMSGGSNGTHGISVDVGYDVAEGTFTNSCEYSTRDREGNNLEWTDEECSIEITSLTEDDVQGSFNFTGTNEDGSEKSVSGIFRVERMGI